MPEYIVELSIGTRKRIVREKLYSSSVDDAEREAINIVKKKEKVEHMCEFCKERKAEVCLDVSGRGLCKKCGPSKTD